MWPSKRAKQLRFEHLELRQLLTASGNELECLEGVTVESLAPSQAEVDITGPTTERELIDIQLADRELPDQFTVQLEHEGQAHTLVLNKHSVFGANTRFLVDDGHGSLVEIDRGPDRSYLGTVVENPTYLVSAQLTEFGLIASIFRDDLPTLVVEPAFDLEDTSKHYLFESDDEATHFHDGDEVHHEHHLEDHPDESDSIASEDDSYGQYSHEPLPDVSALATLPPTRVLDVLEFEVGVEIGSKAFFASTAYNGNLAAAQASAASVATNMDARYLRGAGIKHTIGTVIIRTNAATDPLRDAIDRSNSSGLSAFRNYWNSNPGEVGTTHDLAVYHVRAAPSGIAYVNSVGTSNRYALSAGNGATSWADGTIVHEFGHSWNLRHVGDTGIFYESKPRNFSGSSSAGGEDVFISVMHGGGDHNIGRLATDEALTVLAAKQAKRSFGTVIDPGPVAPFGHRDEAVVGDGPVTIDVIANDYDANNDVLEVRILDTVSQQGGTITLSDDTGPGGRDELIYTPPAGGLNTTDFFHYTVVDSTGRTDWGAVYVEYAGPAIVDLAETSYNYDFGTPTSPVLSGDWQRISPDTFGDISWTNSVNAADRGAGSGANDANRDFVYSNNSATLEHKIANGTWRVTLNMGDASSDRDLMAVWVEGNLITDGITSLSGQYSYVGTSGGSSTPTSFEVFVADGSLSLTIDDLGGNPTWVLNRMSLQFVGATPNVLQALIDPISGATVLRNPTNGNVQFDGYAFQDTVASLLPAQWFSFEDQGYESGIWFEAGPTEYALSELTSESVTTLSPGESVYLGKLVDPLVAQELTFQYFLSDTLELTQGVVEFVNPEAQILPGDYNGDLQVDLADYTEWRNNLGTSTAPFTGSDGNGNGVIDLADYRLWKKQFGDSLQSFTLIDATNGNGEFAVDSTSDVSGVGIPTSSLAIDLDRDRAFSFSGSNSAGQGVRIDGWQITRASYPGGNTAIGVDGNFGFAVDAGTNPGQTGQAFANSGAVLVTADNLQGAFGAGDVLAVSYLLGSDTSESTTVQSQLSVLVDGGMPSESAFLFDTVTANGLSTPRIRERYTLTQQASTVQLTFLIDGVESGERTVLDSVEVELFRRPAMSAASSGFTFSRVPTVDVDSEPTSLFAMDLYSTGSPSATNTESFTSLSNDDIADRQRSVLLLLTTPLPDVEPGEGSLDYQIRGSENTQPSLYAIDDFFHTFAENLESNSMEISVQ